MQAAVQYSDLLTVYCLLVYCLLWEVAGGLVLTSLAKKGAVFTVVVCIDVYRIKTFSFNRRVHSSGAVEKRWW